MMMSSHNLKEIKMPDDRFDDKYDHDEEYFDYETAMMYFASWLTDEDIENQNA